MAGATKRPHSSSQSRGEKSVEKHLKVSITKSDSNAESVLPAVKYNFIYSESDGTSDSEFEEHPYSKQVKISLPRPTKQRLRGDSCSSGKKSEECPSRNAMNARLNRLRKKKYIEGLESKNTELKEENEMLKDILDSRMEEIASLKRETVNLRNVIRNSTEIGKLLQCIQENTNLSISSSLINSNTLSSAVNLQSSSSIPQAGAARAETLPIKEEALISSILWGMALHTLCQPYKRNSPNNDISNKNKSGVYFVNVFQCSMVNDNSDFILGLPHYFSKIFCGAQEILKPQIEALVFTRTYIHVINLM